MLANVLPFYTPLTPGGGQKVTSFLKVVLLHVKIAEVDQRTQCKQIVRPLIHPRHPDGVNINGKKCF